MEFQTEIEAKENERSLSVALLCAGMLCELERVLWECDGFFCSMSVAYDGERLVAVVAQTSCFEVLSFTESK